MPNTAASREDAIIAVFESHERAEEVSALEGAVVVGGLSALGAALYSLGVPKESIVKYETALKADKFLLIAHGDPAEVERARGIMERLNAARRGRCGTDRRLFLSHLVAGRDGRGW